MKQLTYFLILLFILGCENETKNTAISMNANLTQKESILSYEVNPLVKNLRFYAKDELGNPFRNHQNLKNWLAKKQQTLVFAMNGGMYLKDLSPQGLYIEINKIKKELNTTQTGYGNFYLQPNGVFYLTNDQKPHIQTTKEFRYSDNIKYATQSGPMLLIDGKIHPKLTKGSKNVHVRNGVGVLPNGNLLFAMSKEGINFMILLLSLKIKNAKMPCILMDLYLKHIYHLKNGVN